MIFIEKSTNGYWDTPVQLRQLFSNLASNAIKFSEAPVAIAVGCEPARAEGEAIRRMVKITVSDNGPGFPNQYSEQIFKIFNRLHDARSGIGIGLALCRRIAELHGGAISASSQPGVGTRIEIILPLHPQD